MTALRVMLLLGVLAVSAAAQTVDIGMDERRTGTTVPPAPTTTSLAPVPTTSSSTSSTTSTSATSSSLPPGTTIVPCGGNPTTGTPPRREGYWNNVRTVGPGCTLPAGGTIYGVRAYIGAKTASSGIKFSAVRREANEARTWLCDVRITTTAVQNAWNDFAISGCPTVAAGSTIEPGWIADALLTELGEWDSVDGCGGAAGAGSNLWAQATSENSMTTWPNTWEPDREDGCRTAIALLVRVGGTTTSTSSSSTTLRPTTSSTTSTSSSSSSTTSTSSSSTSSTSSSTTTSTSSSTSSSSTSTTSTTSSCTTFTTIMCPSREATCPEL